jgi:hypothetical protein
MGRAESRAGAALRELNAGIAELLNAMGLSRPPMKPGEMILRSQ